MGSFSPGVATKRPIRYQRYTFHIEANMARTDPDEDLPEEKPRPRRSSGRDEEERIQPRRPKPARSERDDDPGDDRSERRRRRANRDEPDDDEGEEAPRRSRRSGDDAHYSAMIPYRNVCALLGYYAGMAGLIAILGGVAFILFGFRQGFATPRMVELVSFLVVYGLGGLFGLMGIVLGILGILHVQNNPRSRGMGHAVTALSLGLLEILGLVGILALGVIARR
jgi:hypothetical protein